ncbi:thiamine phosphate synthase [Fulvivirga sp. M361]|uniref:thiamine phosphate synthase n=1 Tax=Fulvivirga sp. M361 TaxID=2594266 RepID=UPI00117A772F|nr:thiamine phosphate synthase [Fulvivirga sp. M361]TRX56051.1 thiamine phosphate synthase [Fulvivirga sp. M361]
MLVVITSEKKIDKEAEYIHQLFEKGLPALHIRKPGWSMNEYDAFLKDIDDKYYTKIVVHNHHELATKFRLKGIHLREKDRLRLGEILGDHIKAYQDNDFSVSSSFHSTDEVKTTASAFDYAFLSPVFSSISKKEYPGRKFDVADLKATVIGLGGIDHHNIAMVEKLGYSGIAVLGALWQRKDPVTHFSQVMKSYHTVFTKMKTIL